MNNKEDENEKAIFIHLEIGLTEVADSFPVLLTLIYLLRAPSPSTSLNVPLFYTYAYTLKMEGACSLKLSPKYIPEKCHYTPIYHVLHSHSCENLKSS
jgi:hypothetical protein